ncbi:hypothetical protein NC653_005861 [Populus alba x Populus x berolinensis]|uniref:Uncharacterized protein n=1 Tax=Populus alba x Populus x berolinensis TaxID=444605 RepID=A0AAD6RDA5_9ROSI|nr:hypothetical protein NC653_005861 [Populus alba x Populus x berolinensis]
MDVGDRSLLVADIISDAVSWDLSFLRAPLPVDVGDSLLAIPLAKNGSGYQPTFCVFKEVRQLLRYSADVEVNRRHSCMFCVVVCGLRRFGSNSLCFALNTTSFTLPGWIGYTIISLIVMCSERIAVCL